MYALSDAVHDNKDLSLYRKSAIYLDKNDYYPSISIEIFQERRPRNFPCYFRILRHAGGAKCGNSMENSNLWLWGLYEFSTSSDLP